MSAKPEKRARQFWVFVDEAVCDGCGICVFFCKPVVFEMSTELSRRGVYPALPRSPQACNDCGLCELACPQLAICVRPAGEPGGER